MKYIEFKAADTEVFKYFYSACLMVGKLDLVKDDIRIHAKLMDAIEANSAKPDKSDEPYKLPEGLGLILTLEDAYYNLAKRIIDQFSFNPALSRKVAPLYDIIDKATDKPILSVSNGSGSSATPK